MRLTQLSKTENPDNKSPYRYADFDFSKDGGFLFCIREDHYTKVVEEDGQCRNTVVAVNLKDGTAQTVFVSFFCMKSILNTVFTFSNLIDHKLDFLFSSTCRYRGIQSTL